MIEDSPADECEREDHEGYRLRGPDRVPCPDCMESAEETLTERMTEAGR